MRTPKTAPLNAEQVIVDQTEVKARGFVLHLVWLVPCFLVFAFYFQTNFRTLHMPESMEAAQLARHISQGHGYTTSLLRPFALHAGAPATAQPELVHPPLYPVLLAVAFNLLAPEDRTVALVSTLCGLLTALLAYLIARRLLDRTAARPGRPLREPQRRLPLLRRRRRQLATARPRYHLGRLPRGAPRPPARQRLVRRGLRSALSRRICPAARAVAGRAPGDPRAAGAAPRPRLRLPARLPDPGRALDAA